MTRTQKLLQIEVQYIFNCYRSRLERINVASKEECLTVFKDIINIHIKTHPKSVLLLISYFYDMLEKRNLIDTILEYIQHIIDYEPRDFSRYCDYELTNIIRAQRLVSRCTLRHGWEETFGNVVTYIYYIRPEWKKNIITDFAVFFREEYEGRIERKQEKYNIKLK